MSAHLILMGPSTAGKSTLMNGLALDSHDEFEFNIDRTWTTRPKRIGEDDTENKFVSPEDLLENDHKFLFRFQTFPAYEYAIEVPDPLSVNEIRMRILMPVFAKKFRDCVPEPTLFCSVNPIHDNPMKIFEERDIDMDHADLLARSMRFTEDKVEADAIANITFQNIVGTAVAVAKLRELVVDSVRNLS